MKIIGSDSRSKERDAKIRKDCVFEENPSQSESGASAWDRKLSGPAAIEGEKKKR